MGGGEGERWRERWMGRERERRIKRGRRKERGKDRRGERGREREGGGEGRGREEEAWGVCVWWGRTIWKLQPDCDILPPA